MRRAEDRGVDRRAIAPKTVFVSHETYTPARGGSASAEINALRHVFGDAADQIVIANTKGFTGHAMGAGVEDVVAIKALETGLVPPVANFREPDPELGDLTLSQGGEYAVEYALRLAAGFGSQIAMTLMRRVPAPDGVRHAPDCLGFDYRVEDRSRWQAWLDRVSRRSGARVEVWKRRLRVVDTGLPSAPAEPTPDVEVVPVEVTTPIVDSRGRAGGRCGCGSCRWWRSMVTRCGRRCWRWWPTRRVIRSTCWTWIWIWRRIWVSTR